MREEGISSSAAPPPPTTTAAACSAGASSPAVGANAGSTEWLGHGQGSKVGSLSRIGSQAMWISMSTSAGGSAIGSSQPSCRPWERGDLLRRLSTFRPANWFGKDKAASSLACARRGWINVDVDKIECESCGATLKYVAPDSRPSTEGVGEEFANQLDEGHKIICPWRGNSCAESLVQFPPTPPSALIGGYKDRCDGLFQFLYLPIVSASTLEQIRVSRGPEIERFLVQSYTFTAGESGCKADIASGSENNRDDALCLYSRAQKLISLCGWEPIWLPNAQDCEENSAQSARNGCSFSPIRDCAPPEDRVSSKKALSTTTKKGYIKNEKVGPSSKFEPRSPLLDCSLCGATVRVMDFLTVNRPARFAPNISDVPETSKKMALTRGASAASGINGWATDPMEKNEDFDEAATTGEGKSMSNIGVDLDLTMGGGFSSGHAHKNVISEQYQDANIGKDLIIGQPASSEVGERATSYESRGPSTRKRNLDEGGSTVDRPHVIMQQADSVEGVVIDRDGDEVNDSKESSGPSKRARESNDFESYQQSYRRDSSGAGPSQTFHFDIERDAPFHHPSTLDSTRASSVIAMDTVYQGEDNDSMDSVENHPGDDDDEINFPSLSAFKSPDLNDMSDLNFSNQAQQSVCPATVRAPGEIGLSSTNDEEVLNTDTATDHRRDGPSLAISGGSVGMGASHEAEIHGADASIHRTESVVGDMEPVAEVTENQGQNGEFTADPGLMGDFVPEGMDQDLMSRSVGRADSGSKIVGSAKAESVESGEKTSNMNILAQEQSTHPSLSCNAVLCSGPEASKDEVTQEGKSFPTDECGYTDYPVANGIGPPNGESNFEEAVEFDPIKHHNFFCPWVNGNVAAAGVSNNNGSSSSSGGLALCGWQLTLDALDGFQALEPNQTVESESAASLYKDDRQISGRKLMARHSVSRSHGQS